MSETKWIATLADGTEHTVEWRPSADDGTDVYIDGHVADEMRSTRIDTQLWHVARLFYNSDDECLAVVEWRREGEPSRAQMRAALEATLPTLEKTIVELREIRDAMSRTQDVMAMAQEVTAAEDAVVLVRAALSTKPATSAEAGVE